MKRSIFIVILILSVVLSWGAKSVKKPAQKPIKPVESPTSKTLADSMLESDYSMQVMGRFMKFYERGVQEKLYIQTDKPYYAAGDTLWLKGYLVNAITLVPENITKYIYVELTDRSDSLIQRIKIMADEHGFHNSLRLQPSLATGEYSLRGYTRWQRNENNNLFFKRTIRVVNSVDNAVTSQVSYLNRDDGTIDATVAIGNSFKEPMADQRIDYTLMIDGRSRRYSSRTDDRGRFTINFQRPTLDAAPNKLELSISSNDVSYVKSHFLPSMSDDFDVQFFPEGGALIPVGLQIVGFKAVGTNGLGVDVSGRVYDRDSVLITEFSSSHRGMGRFSVMPRPFERLYAVVTSARGVTKRVELPQVVESGCALQVIAFRGSMLYKVNMTPDISPDSLALVVQSRGRIMFAEELNARSLSKAIRLDGFPCGVVQLAVVHKRSGDIVSQRLFFVRTAGRAVAEIVADKRTYAPRQAVQMQIKVTDSNGAPAVGDFALSVTDAGVVSSDSTADNIVSSLLLCSDLRGYLEDPGYYLSDNSAEVVEDLNVLMLTQGWSRFDLPSVLRGDLAPYQFSKESSQSISGSINGFFGNAAKNPQILIMEPKTGFFDMFKLNGNSKFNMSGMTFPDSTVYVLQAMSKNGGVRSLTLNIVPESFPSRQSFIPKPHISQFMNRLPDAFLQQSKERYYYQGGMRVIDMQSVVVTTRANERKNKMYGVTASRSISGDKLKIYESLDIFAVLQTFPGVQVFGENVSVRGSDVPPLVFIDNMPMDIESLNAVNMSDVDYVDLVVGPEAVIFGIGSSSGVILIGTKTGEGVSSNTSPLPSVAKVAHLGYKKPTAFYQPRYDVEAVRQSKTPDLRTTIAWDPSIRTDSTGMATVQFYTADKSTTYHVNLEGITLKGEPCHAEATLRRE